MKYRIMEVTRGSSVHYYVVQKRFLFWWFDSAWKHLSYFDATEEINKETQVSTKYHEVDINNLGLKVKFVDENGTEIPCPLTIPKSN